MMLNINPLPRVYLALGPYKYLEKSLKRRKIFERCQRNYAKTMQAVERIACIPSQAEIDALYQKTALRADLPNNLIFQYWHQGSVNLENCSIIHAISNVSVNKYANGKRLILDKNSLSDYVSLPKEIINLLEKEHRLALLSDLVRTALLFAYGGTWLDFTILLLNHLPDYRDKVSPFLFMHNDRPDDYHRYEVFDPRYFSWEKDFPIDILSSFMQAKGKDYFLGVMLFNMLKMIKEDWQHCDYFIYQIMWHYLINQPFFAELKAKLSSLPSDAYAHYLLVHNYAKLSHERCKYLKQNLPVQKLNARFRLIKGSLGYECIKHEGFI